jgi:hypothetical protein
MREGKGEGWEARGMVRSSSCDGEVADEDEDPFATAAARSRAATASW